MKITSRFILGGTVVFAAIFCGCVNKKTQKTSVEKKLQHAIIDDKTQEKVFTLYDGFKKDLIALRKTTRLKSPVIDASSGEACEAARQIFGRVSFLFKNREDVLKLLGDPATISWYNKKLKSGPREPLVYIFDTGEKGNRYTLKFPYGVCMGIEVKTIQ